MEQAMTIGLDIAKHVLQAHAADAAGHLLFRKQLTRARLLGFFVKRQKNDAADAQAICEAAQRPSDALCSHQRRGAAGEQRRVPGP